MMKSCRSLQFTVPAVCTLLLGACTSGDYYEALRDNQRQQCINKPQTVAESCLQRTEDDYQQYKSKRETLKSQVADQGGDSTKEVGDPRYKDWVP